MIAVSKFASVRTVLTLGCLCFALAGQHAEAVGGGSPDPSSIPVFQALRVQVYGLDQELLAVTGVVALEDLPILAQLADELARVDAQVAVVAVRGGRPDPAAA